MSCVEHCQVTSGFLHFSSVPKTYEEAKLECSGRYDGQLAALKTYEDWTEVQQNCCENSTATAAVESSRDYFMGLNFCPMEGTYTWEGGNGVCDETPLLPRTSAFVRDCARILVKPNRLLTNGYPDSRLVDCDNPSPNSYFICHSTEYVEPTTTTPSAATTLMSDDKELAAASSLLLIAIVAVVAVLILLSLLVFAFRKKISSALGCESHKSYQLKDHK